MRHVRTVRKRLAKLLLAPLVFLLLPSVSTPPDATGRPLFPGSALSAQEPTPTTTMLARLAEAVDGYRNGDSVWVAMSIDYPHDVVGVFLSLEEAQDSIVGIERTSVFGPYLSELDERPEDAPGFAPTPQLLILGLGICDLHIYPTICPGPRQSITETIRYSDIDSVAVEVYAGDSLYRRYPLSPDVDAVFLTVAAMDKFYFPYITSLFGPRRALELRDRVIQTLLGLEVRDPN